MLQDFSLLLKSHVKRSLPSATPVSGLLTSRSLLETILVLGFEVGTIRLGFWVCLWVLGFDVGFWVCLTGTLVVTTLTGARVDVVVVVVAAVVVVLGVVVVWRTGAFGFDLKIFLGRVFLVGSMFDDLVAFAEAPLTKVRKHLKVIWWMNVKFNEFAHRKVQDTSWSKSPRRCIQSKEAPKYLDVIQITFLSVWVWPVCTSLPWWSSHWAHSYRCTGWRTTDRPCKRWPHIQPSNQ